MAIMVLLPFMVLLLLWIYNLLLLQLHFWVFKTSMPFIAFVGVLLHLIGLIYLPYKKFFNNETF